MPLIVLRLHPIAPVDGNDFSAYLDGLSIEVIDLGVSTLPDGVSLGVAEYVAPPQNPFAPFEPDPATGIVQHWGPREQQPFGGAGFLAAATAVVDIPAAAGPEHDSRDVRIKITRGAAATVVDRRVYFNVPVYGGPIPDRRDFPAISVTSVFVGLGDPASDPDPNDAVVTVPEDGTPPRFDDLFGAVSIVLGHDPGVGNLPPLADLTPRQARHVAYEIVWNQKFRPLPGPRDRTLEQMYTLPDNKDPSDEAARGRFQGDLQAYYAAGDAEAERLAGFVYALAAAVHCEARSSAAERVGFLLPVRLDEGSSESRFKSVRVVLTGRAAGDPPAGAGAVPAELSTQFTVPAAYFYALGATMPTQIDRDERYRLATLQDESNVRAALEAAVSLRVMVPNAVGDVDGVNVPQAARRLRALGAVSGVAPEFAVNDTADVNAAPRPVARAAVRALLENPAPPDWLDYKGADITGFWNDALTAQQLDGHLELVLLALTGGFQPLIDTIKAGLPPGNPPAAAAADIDDLPDSAWRDLFGSPIDATLLPPFTAPGTPEERVSGFVRHVAKFFAVGTAADRPDDPVLDAPPRFHALDTDPLTVFVERFEVRHGSPFQFGQPWVDADVTAAVEDVFPSAEAPEAQAWLYETVWIIDQLALLAQGVPDGLVFSVMEALYARGFTRRRDVGALALAEFRDALVGTVAFEHAATIHGNGEGLVEPPPPGQGEVRAVNPDGCLVNCVPPEHRSPLGPFAYLRALLELREDATCEGTAEGGEVPTLGELLTGRRGPVGDLLVTAANAGTRLPLIDLVLESLEALAADPANPAGAVHQTNNTVVAGHRLDEHDPEMLFAAVPEHSTPATPVAEPAAYDNVRVDFSRPGLPYSQPLDVNRTYLRHLRTSRYAAMRRFRADITEFVLDPAAEPAAFRRHLWRYPVRISIAREYLGITPEEYDLLFTRDLVDAPAPGHLLTRELYGFGSNEVGGVAWTDIVVRLPEFLTRTGLSWCEFIDLWQSEFVIFDRAGDDPAFPDCEPCHLDDYRLEGLDGTDLKKIAVFVRLWRKLCLLPGGGYSVAQLADICNVLRMYDNGAINPDFIRQLVAFRMLLDEFCLPLTDGTPPAPGATGADRTHILALWAQNANAWSWARDEFLEQARRHASRRYHCEMPGPEFLKLLDDNLDALSVLAGFDPATPAATWQARPTHTLRFAEVLAKIAASPFGVGEVLYLFTADRHLRGDDPFPQQPDNEADEVPLGLPDDERPFSLSDLRAKLLRVADEITDDDAAAWTWPRIEAALRAKFGYRPPVAGPDPLRRLGEHFFPTILADSGLPVASVSRQYRVAVRAPAPAMWNTPPAGPFRYDVATGELFTELPLTDEAVLAKLARVRQLNPDEADAVRQLYFLPRVDLAAFALLFENFTHADQRLIEEPDEARRWAWFQRAFALFHERCAIIAEHLAGHVAEWTGEEDEDDTARAWHLLAYLYADENRRLNAPWEDDAGQAPPALWPDRPSGGAFAAILGLAGTGLVGEFTPEGGPLAWREVRGPLNPFGDDRDSVNSPVPTVLPTMNLTLTPQQEQFVTVRNGFAMTNPDGAPLGGAQGFTARWTGMFLVDEPGRYEFSAGGPTPHGEQPDAHAAEHKRWRVLLTRGQRRWLVLAHNWPDEEVEDAGPVPLTLRRGTYELTVELAQPSPEFAEPEEIAPTRGGFEVKYCGPDTLGELVTIPHHRLFQISKDRLLDAGIRLGAGAPRSYLAGQYTSSLRDIRRTYERAFKALLFGHRLGLSPRPESDDGQSELGYMLAHADRFSGRSVYPDQAGYAVHLASFDFNLVPLRDNFWSPAPAQDRRSSPTNRRKQALFDWWERLFDYTIVRRDAGSAPERPLWLLFHEAAETHPDPPAQLLRHMGADLLHAPLLLRYFPGVKLTSAELEDDRWTVRAWHAETWLRALRRDFSVRDIRDARPDLWAADGPESVPAGEQESGNENLTAFIRAGCIENGDPRRYEDIKALNDALRVRGQAALLTYLCAMDRVPIRPGVFAATPRELGSLLLMDVEAGLCQHATRVEEAIGAVQSFVARARLGLEPTFAVRPGFALLWDRRFATFRIWEACRRRILYRENWIEWDELEQARRTEAFRFLELELRRSALTLPVPGGVEYWPDLRPPDHPAFALLQAREPAGTRRINPDHHGFGLLGTPERHARPSWLAALPVPAQDAEDGNGEHHEIEEFRAAIGDDEPTAAVEDAGVAHLPWWIQAAVRVGARFIRVAAAGEPPASTELTPRRDDTAAEPCCERCGRAHPPALDEYYFWLLDTRFYAAVTQTADDGVGRVAQDHPAFDAEQPTWTWHDPSLLPRLLHWNGDAMVHLAWCRVHNGEFSPPRRSDEGLAVQAPGPELVFAGRTDDSLRFEVADGQNRFEVAGGQNLNADPTPPGFRYDMATDTAVPLPLVIKPPKPPAEPPFRHPGELQAYPYFAYFGPGAPVTPPSLFGVSVAVAAALRAHCRFEAALHWYALSFAPLASDATWLRRPPQEDQPEGYCCHDSTVATDEDARRRAIVLHVLETLREWGDAVMRRNTDEAFQQARLLYDTLATVLGDPPRAVLAVDGSPPEIVSEFAPHHAPLNPRLLSLYEQSTDRLALIHACLNVNRRRGGRTPAWGNTRLRDGWQSTADACLDDDDWCLPACPYRFTYLLQKAQELAAEVRNLGAALLAAYEKGDGEYLASLRATHERQLLDLATEIRQNQWREADWQVQALQKTKEMTQTRHRYYTLLIQNGRNNREDEHVALINTSVGERTAGNISEGISQVMSAIPDIFAGFPVTQTWIPLGTKLSGVFMAVARIANTLAEIATTTGGLRLTEAGWERREEEWRHQVEVLGLELQQIERQTLAAERRRDIALRELNNHQRQLENAAEVHDFLRDKYTNHELYFFLQQETAALHSQMYSLALHAARQAQRAFNLERGHLAKTFITGEVWDNLHEGLQAGERLGLALRQMEQAYFCANEREYELTKHISLRLHAPVAFMTLLATGVCEIELPEWLFDLDYPGHFMRRVKNVTLTIPCVAGPYTGVHCRLTLLSSTTRADPRLSLPARGCCRTPCECRSDDPCCCCEPSPNGYEALPDDPRVVPMYAATEAIATSSGQNDSGMFELNFRDERYLPFEFAGAVSRWRIELPPENNFFDFDTVSDVVLHLNYTAREGGDQLRAAAAERARCRLPGDGLRFFDVRRDLPDAWTALQQPDVGASRTHNLPFTLSDAMFPFVPAHRVRWVRSLQVLFEAPNAEPSSPHVVRFHPAPRPGRAADDHHRHRDAAPDRIDVHCVATRHYPGLFWGVLDLDSSHLGPLQPGGPAELGTFEFPAEVGEICEVYLVTGYCAGPSPHCGEPGERRACHSHRHDPRDRRAGAGW